jgi:tetratricopeptide (TPR) repeat protein
MKRALVFLLLGCMVEFGFGQEFLLKGKAALASKDTAAAIAAFEQALKVNQKAGETHYQLGAIALARGQVADAAKHLEEAVRIDDENVDALRLLGDTYVKSNNLAGAITQFKRAVKYGPKNGAVSASYGKALLAADSTDAAIRELTRAKEYLPDDPSLYEALGDAFAKQNVVSMVVANYQRAIELEPTGTARRIKLANVFEKNRQYTEAVKEFDEIIKRDTTNADAYRQKGNILLRAKMYRLAIAPLRTYTELQPKSAEGGLLYSRALFGAKAWTDLIPEAKRALKLDSTNAEVWRMLANAQVEAGTKDTSLFRQAVRSFETLKRLKAFGRTDQADYGTALFRSGQDDAAMAALLDAIAADSTICDAYASLGSIYMRKTDFVKAAAMFDKRIDCEPQSVPAAVYLNGANSNMQTKNYARTRALLTRLTELRPDLPQARFAKARYFSQVDSLDYAKAEYDTVIQQIGTRTDKFRREIAEAYYEIGRYYVTKQQFGASIEALKKAASFGYPGETTLHLIWGSALLNTLDRTPTDPAQNRAKVLDAIDHFRRSIKADQNNSAAHLNLGLALLQARIEGEDAKNKQIREEACGEFRLVLKREPKNDEARAAMERIGCQ